jgi:hypothetical protein
VIGAELELRHVAAFMNNVYGPNAAPGDEAGGDETGRGGQLGMA